VGYRVDRAGGRIGDKNMLHTAISFQIGILYYYNIPFCKMQAFFPSYAQMLV
jgi:hypothetical protein